MDLEVKHESGIENPIRTDRQNSCWLQNELKSVNLNHSWQKIEGWIFINYINRQPPKIAMFSLKEMFLFNANMS